MDVSYPLFSQELPKDTFSDNNDILSILSISPSLCPIYKKTVDVNFAVAYITELQRPVDHR